MKLFRLLFYASLLALISIDLKAQVTIGSLNLPDPSSILDLKNKDDDTSDKGILFPRVFLINTDTFGLNGNSQTAGIIVYNINTNITGANQHGTGLYYWDGSQWRWLNDSGDFWKLNGNINGIEKKLGTTDNFSLPIITNNIERLRIDAGTTSTVINVSRTLPAKISFGNYVSSNIAVPHIALYETSTSLYGLGVTSSQLNYLTNGTHVFYSGGSTPVEELRIQRGTGTTSSLKIAHIPVGNESNRRLVISDDNQVFYEDPVKFTYEINIAPGEETLIPIKETYVTDRFTIRIERDKLFGTATFTATRGAISNFTRIFTMIYQSGNVEPVNDDQKNGYSVTNAITVAKGQPNKLRLTYANAPSSYGSTKIFDFEIGIIVDSNNIKYLSIKNLATDMNDPSWALTGSHKYYIVQERIY